MITPALHHREAPEAHLSQCAVLQVLEGAWHPSSHPPDYRERPHSQCWQTVSTGHLRGSCCPQHTPATIPLCYCALLAPSLCWHHIPIWVGSSSNTLALMQWVEMSKLPTKLIRGMKFPPGYGSWDLGWGALWEGKKAEFRTFTTCSPLAVSPDTGSAVRCATTNTRLGQMRWIFHKSYAFRTLH